jgi:hypothetical protein
METQLREKPLQGSQTQEFHYLEDKARNKTVTLTYTYLKGSSMDSFTLGLLPKIDFNMSKVTAHRQPLES